MLKDLITLNHMFLKLFYFVFGLCIFMLSCNNIVEYSPYDSDVKKIQHNTYEIKKIKQNQINVSTSDTFKFAIISDTHEWYDETKEAVNSINRQKGIQFVMCCGDVANAGLAQEYKWYFDGIKKCNYPVITVIGNHDYRSNGKMIFQKLFGSTNNSLVVGAYKFILFDNIIWEGGNKSPLYEWLVDELADTSHFNIVFAHIPPWSDQMEGINKMVFKQIVTPSNTVLCVHGHTHSFSDTKYNGIHTIVSGNIGDREYLIVSMIKTKSLLERVKF